MWLKGMNKSQLLVISQDSIQSSVISRELGDDYEVVRLESSQLIQAQPELLPAAIIWDLNRSEVSDSSVTDASVIETILRENVFAKIIILANDQDRERALAAIAQGAYWYLTKPLDLFELRMRVNDAVFVRNLQMRITISKESAADLPPEMQGTSEEITRFREFIRKVALTNLSVLIVAEIGTEPELVARAIHDLSRRKAGLFQRIDCSDRTPDAIEIELRKSLCLDRKGSASQSRAHGGLKENSTIFLDGIDGLSLEGQAMLLRLLKESEALQPVQRLTSIGSRIISSVAKPIEAAIESKDFLAELYYRISIFVTRIPPLRERKGDTALIADELLCQFTKEMGKPILGFTSKAITALEDYSWPGNFPELANCIMRAVFAAEGRFITDIHLGLNLPHKETAEPDMSIRTLRRISEKELLEESLAKHNRNISQTARELGVSRPTLYSLLRKHNID